jgi:hypothetical protein
MAWQKGESGNPGGRFRTDRPARLRERLAEHGEEVVAKLIELAKAGDPSALNIYFNKVLPSLKPHMAPVLLPAMDGSLTERANAVLAAAERGDIPLDAATEYVKAAAVLLTVTVGDELKARIDQLQHGHLA